MSNRTVYFKYIVSGLCLALILISLNVKAQRPSINSIPSMPGFSLSYFDEADHISNYTWKKFGKKDIRQIIKNGACSSPTDIGKIIDFTKDGWIKNIYEMECARKAYLNFKVITELKEVVFLNNVYRITFRVKYYSIKNKDSLEFESDQTKEFNKHGFIIKSVYRNYFEDIITTNYFYDEYYHIINYVTYKEIKGKHKTDTFSTLHDMKYLYIQNHDTFVVIEYYGKLDSLTNDVSYYKEKKEKEDLQPTDFYLKTAKNHYSIYYIYYFAPTGQLLNYDQFNYSYNLKYINTKYYILTEEIKNKLEANDRNGVWVKFKRNAKIEMDAESLKFLYF